MFEFDEFYKNHVHSNHVYTSPAGAPWGPPRAGSPAARWTRAIMMMMMIIIIIILIIVIIITMVVVIIKHDNGKYDYYHDHNT